MCAGGNEASKFAELRLMEALSAANKIQGPMASLKQNTTYKCLKALSVLCDHSVHE